jgi:predicted homoserine dehydrogenase-like protein
VQTTTSILAAGCLGLPTGASEMRPKVDLVARATKPLKAGQKLNMIKDHVIPGVEPELAPATVMAPNQPIPFYMVAENRVKVDVPAGTLLTYNMVEAPPDSVLWSLKKKQDEAFLD